MNHKWSLAPGLVLLAATIVVAAGCGGGHKSSAPPTTAATTTAATTTAAAPTTTAAAATTSASTPSVPSFASAGNCQKLVQAESKFGTALSSSSGAGDLKTEAQLLQQYAKEAPSDIKADFQVIADYFTKAAGALGNLKPGTTPTPAQIAKLQQLSTSIDATKIAAAGQHIAAWVTTNCHA